MIHYLFAPIPLWGAISLFLVGVVIGYCIRRKYDKSHSYERVRLEAFIQVVVFILWTIATARAVILDVPYPPLFLNIIFGAVFGSMNKGIGTYITTLATVLKK